jgi:hypothetical protein
MLSGTTVALSIAYAINVYIYLAMSATAGGGGLAVQLLKALKPPETVCS